MANKSQYTKDWRKRTKSRIVEAMGGKCALCGYSKCHWSLVLHHLDPTQKDFSLAAIRASCKSWEKIVNELRKCILVCHNCHGEIHHGITTIPDDVAKFNEAYSTYTSL